MYCGMDDTSSSVESYLRDVRDRSEGMGEGREREWERECTVCPLWVLRCVHMNGSILTLIDMVNPHEPSCIRIRDSMVNFLVAYGDRFEPCNSSISFLGCKSIVFHQTDIHFTCETLEQAKRRFTEWEREWEEERLAG